MNEYLYPASTVYSAAAIGAVVFGIGFWIIGYLLGRLSSK